MDPIFAKTRHWYDSYTDFWRLVDLSGFQTCYVDEIDLEKDGLFITTPINGELRPHVDYRQKKAKIIWWNLERPDTNGKAEFAEDYQKGNTEILNYIDNIWVSDRYLQSVDPRSIFVILGSHPGLAEIDRIGAEAYDYTCMSYINSRRRTILDQLKDFRMGPNAWGDERTQILRSTPIMLNIHQTPAPICEPLRFVLAAAYGMALISEICVDPWPLTDEEILMEKYNSLGEVTSKFIKAKGAMSYGNRLKKKLTFDWNFRRGVEKVLSEMPL